jgi:HSP20 family protein
MIMAANSLTERNDERNMQAREETRSNEKYIQPAVNIIETEEGLVLTADIPGASKDALDVNVEKGTGTAQHTGHLCLSGI